MVHDFLMKENVNQWAPRKGTPSALESKLEKLMAKNNIHFVGRRMQEGGGGGGGGGGGKRGGRRRMVDATRGGGAAAAAEEEAAESTVAAAKAVDRRGSSRSLKG